MMIISKKRRMFAASKTIQSVTLFSIISFFLGLTDNSDHSGVYFK